MPSNRYSSPFASPAHRFLIVLATLLLVVSSPALSFAIGDRLVGSFIDDGIPALARGGLEQLPERQDRLDFDSPLFLDSLGKFRAESFYENQRTLRLYHGRWSGTHAYSDHLETSAAVPFSLFDRRVTGSAAAGYGHQSADVRGENGSEDLTILYRENIECGKGGFYLQAVDRLRIGVAAISNNVRKGLEIPVELEVAPVSFLKLGYKHSYIDFAPDLQASMSGHDASLQLKDLEEINELYGVVDYSKRLYLKYANDIADSGNRRIEGKLWLPASVYLVGNYSRREFAGIDQPIMVDGENGGTFHGRFRKSQYRVGIGAAVNEKWTVEANYRHGDFSSEGGGTASTRAIATFWPSLLLGNYNYLYAASLSGDQYHLGAEYQGNRFNFGFGFQYLDLRPSARLDYWRNVLFGIGETGAGKLELTTDRVEMIFFSFGVGYRWDNVGIRYAFGQFIPISMHDTSGSGSTSSGNGGSGGGGNFFDSLADKITHNPGGNIQRVMLTVTF